MSDANETERQPLDVEKLVYNAVQSYVLGRVKSKAGLTWGEAKQDERKKVEYSGVKAKIAREAFLAVRSRTGDDFVDYFVGTLCSVPQRGGEDMYLALSRALLAETAKIRTLTLLALSAMG